MAHAEIYKPSQQELLDLLHLRLFDCLSNPDIHARDLASIGNLVLNLQRREDEINNTTSSNNVAAFPAMPPIPPDAKRALRNADSAFKNRRGDRIP